MCLFKNFIAVFSLIFIAMYTARMASILSVEQKHNSFEKQNFDKV